MKNYIKWGLIIIASLVVAFLILQSVIRGFIEEITEDVVLTTYEEEASDVDLQKQAVFFELSDIYDNTVKISDFLGSPLILTFWTTWNAQSTDQIKIFDDYLSKNKKSLFKIITINSQEDKSTVLNFIKRGGYQIEVLLDEEGEISDIYEARNLPATYFLDKDGIIKDIFTGVLNEKMLVDKSEKIINQ